VRRLPLFLFFVAGCGGPTTTLSESSTLDRLRLLGVRATVAVDPDPVLGSRAEPRPGETVAFSSLVYTPENEPLEGALWIGCLPEGELSYGCEIDESALEGFNNLDDDSSQQEFIEAIQDAQEAGLIGFEPLFAPEWTIPAEALDSLEPEDRLEGINAFVNVTLIPEGIAGEKSDDAFGAAEGGFKRMPVSEAVSPNHNPDIVDFTVAGVLLDGAEGFTAQRGLTYIIEPHTPEGHVETYSYQTSEGETEYRTEEPFYQWYTEPGSTNAERTASFDQALSLAPFSSVEWTAPNQAGVVMLYAVVRDRRGGMGWRSLKVNVL
jgi:hypothetical protein